MPGRVGIAALAEPILTASEIRQSHEVSLPWVAFYYNRERTVKVNYWLMPIGLPTITYPAPML